MALFTRASLASASNMAFTAFSLGANGRPSSSPHKHRREMVVRPLICFLPEVARTLKTLHVDLQPDINNKDPGRRRAHSEWNDVIMVHACPKSTSC